MLRTNDEEKHAKRNVDALEVPQFCLDVALFFASAEIRAYCDRRGGAECVHLPHRDRCAAGLSFRKLRTFQLWVQRIKHTRMCRGFGVAPQLDGRRHEVLRRRAKKGEKLVFGRSVAQGAWPPIVLCMLGSVVPPERCRLRVSSLTAQPCGFE